MEKLSASRIPSDDTPLLMDYWDGMKRRGFLEPEKYLMLAVLKDAFTDYTRSRSTDDGRFKKARSWFFFEHSKRLFAFESICEILNLDASFIRRRLAELPEHRHRPFLHLVHSVPGASAKKSS